MNLYLVVSLSARLNDFVGQAVEDISFCVLENFLMHLKVF